MSKSTTHSYTFAHELGITGELKFGDFLSLGASHKFTNTIGRSSTTGLSWST